MRLIDAHALRRRFTVNDDGTRISENDCDNFPNEVSIRMVKRMISDAPTIDAAPVARAKWEDKTEKDCYEMYECDRCAFALGNVYICEYNYCPNCGAKMKGE